MSPLRCPRIDASVTEQSGWIRTENSGGREYSEEFSLQAKETKSRSPNLNSSPNLTLHCPSNHVHDNRPPNAILVAASVSHHNSLACAGVQFLVLELWNVRHC